MELNFLKTQNGIAEWEDLGDRLYRGRTKDGKEVIAKTEHEEAGTMKRRRQSSTTISRAMRARCAACFMA